MGAWKVDSTYTFYNGFDFTEKQDGFDWAVLLYEPNNLVKEIKYGTYRQHQYEWIGRDSLVFKDFHGNIASAFSVLKLNDVQLVLRKSKAPLFKGANQNRFEVRYFSRTEIPENIEAFTAPSDPHNQ